jgi:ribosome-binding protein aMBF1 (putative translation factor)
MDLNLKAYLAIMGMSFKDFSIKVDVNPHYLARISSGNVKPSRRLAKQIEEATEGNVKIVPSEKVVGGAKRKATASAT